jgi:YbbR domain-containing protein
MEVLRGLLFDNLGLKLVALLLALVVYLNVYTDRPTTMTVSFPIQLNDIGDSLSLSGPVPGAVQAELRGTGKQLIRVRLSEPMLKISLAGVGRGRFERAVSAADLPVTASDGIEIERVIGPRMLQIQLDRKISRSVPVAPRVDGTLGAGVSGKVVAIPDHVTVRGPEAVVSALDSVVLDRLRVDGRRDTVRARVSPEGLPDWCSTDPATVTVRVTLRPPSR